MSTAVSPSPPPAMAALPLRRGGRLRREPIQSLVWLVTAVLVVVPLLPLAYASVRSRPLYESGGSFTLRGYRTLLSDPAFWTAVLNTVEFTSCAASTAAQTPTACLRSASWASSTR